MRPEPSTQVVSWVGKQAAANLFTTSITEAEIFYGIELLANGKRRDRLLVAAAAMFEDDLPRRFDRHCGLLFRISRLSLMRKRQPPIKAQTPQSLNFEG